MQGTICAACRSTEVFSRLIEAYQAKTKIKARSQGLFKTVELSCQETLRHGIVRKGARILLAGTFTDGPNRTLLRSLILTCLVRVSLTASVPKTTALVNQTAPIPAPACSTDEAWLHKPATFGPSGCSLAIEGFRDKLQEWRTEGDMLFFDERKILSTRPWKATEQPTPLKVTEYECSAAIAMLYAIPPSLLPSHISPSHKAPVDVASHGEVRIALYAVYAECSAGDSYLPGWMAIGGSLHHTQVHFAER